MKHLTRALLALLAGALLLGIAVPAQAATAAPRGTKPSAAFFGMHHHALGLDGSFPESGAVGSVRLWDTYTAWKQVEPTRGDFQWGTLDKAVETAHANGASVLYVMGSSPDWAVGDQHPRFTPAYGGTANIAPINDADWVAYVAAVATRYKGRIEAYEVWNEMNILGYYEGNVKRMVRLTSLAYRTIKRIDPAATVAAPSTTIRGTTGLRYQRLFAEMGGYRFADAANVHLYPNPNQTPEDSAAMLGTVRATLRKAGVSKPIWNTEMNYALPLHGTPRSQPLTEREQAAWIIRSYVLMWNGGVKRQYWYDWGRADFLGIKTVETDGHTASLAGRAFGVARRWMTGYVRPCTIDRKGTYSCTVTGRGVIRWNPSHKAWSAAPKGVHRVQDEAGTWRPVKAGARVGVSAYPILLAK